MGADPYQCLVGKPCDMTMVSHYVAALAAANVAQQLDGPAGLQGHHSTPLGPVQKGRCCPIRSVAKVAIEGTKGFAWTYVWSKLTDAHDVLAVLQQLNVTGT